MIYAFENDDELTKENAAKYTTLHPRCGTSFLIIVMSSLAKIEAAIAGRIAFLAPDMFTVPLSGFPPCIMN